MGGASIDMYRNEKYGYIHSQSSMTSLGSGSSTYNNMFPSQMIPNMSVALPLNYASSRVQLFWFMLMFLPIRLLSLE